MADAQWRKRWTEQQHFCSFTWAAGNVAIFPHELKVMMGQGHSHSLQLMPTSGGDLSEDWDGARREMQGMAQLVHQCCLKRQPVWLLPKLSSSVMWKGNGVKKQAAFLFTENTDWNKQPSSASPCTAAEVYPVIRKNYTLKLPASLFFNQGGQNAYFSFPPTTGFNEPHL